MASSRCSQKRLCLSFYWHNYQQFKMRKGISWLMIFRFSKAFLQSGAQARMNFQWQGFICQVVAKALIPRQCLKSEGVRSSSIRQIQIGFALTLLALNGHNLLTRISFTINEGQLQSIVLQINMILSLSFVTSKLSKKCCTRLNAATVDRETYPFGSLIICLRKV